VRKSNERSSLVAHRKIPIKQKTKKRKKRRKKANKTNKEIGADLYTDCSWRGLKEIYSRNLVAATPE